MSGTPASAVCWLTWLSKVFLIPKKGSKRFRLVIDLREFNATQTEASCEVETLRQLRAQLRPKDYIRGAGGASSGSTPRKIGTGPTTKYCTKGAEESGVRCHLV